MTCHCRICRERRFQRFVVRFWIAAFVAIAVGAILGLCSWEKCLATYDHADGFFFLDPPYLAAGGEAYAGWSEHELARFGERVKTLQARWMITFQDCSQIRDLFVGYKLKAIERANGIGNNGHKPKGRVYREVIITNDPAQPVRQRKGASA